MRLTLGGAAAVIVLALVMPATAFMCPLVIKQADDAIQKAEAGKVTADTRPLIDEAKKQVGEARALHENANSRRDHADAVRKARVATAYAEEAILLEGP